MTASQPIASYPITEALQLASQPLVLLDDGVIYVKSRAAGAPFRLVTAMGTEHSLRVLTTFDEEADRARSVYRQFVLNVIDRELNLRSASAGADHLPYVVESLAPALTARDWSETVDPSFEGSVVDGSLRDRVDRSSELSSLGAIDELTSRMPRVRSIGAAFVLCGRAWKLTPSAAPAREALYVIAPQSCYRLTGEFYRLGALHEAVLRSLTEFATGAAASLASARRTHELRDTPAVVAARRDVTERGWWQSGDLLYLAGHPPRLAYVMPPHDNMVLGGFRDRNIAVALPINADFALGGSVEVYCRQGDRWHRYQPPHGVCFGSGAPVRDELSPALHLAVWLRWCAVRLASNQCFHASDNAPVETDAITY